VTYPQEPGFSLKDGKLALSKIGYIKIKLHRQIEGKIKACTVRKDGDHWYACFSVEYEPGKKPVPAKTIGIDMGIKCFAVLSDGTPPIENPKHLVRSGVKLAKLQRELSRKKRGSSSRKKAKAAVARLHRKVRNQRSDFHHKISREIVNNYGLIRIEDLHIRNMVRNHHLAKSISDAGWGQFFNYLAYKAEEAGCVVEKVAPHHTSILCSRCGENVPKSLSVRTHRCPFCGLVLDRDLNAAINILNKPTVGITESYARGESALSGPSLNWEASSVRAG
jgi:putative transposase